MSSSFINCLRKHIPTSSVSVVLPLHQVSVLTSSSTEYLFYHHPPRVSVLSLLSCSKELQDYPPPPPIVPQVEHVKVIITSSGQPLLITPVDQKLRDLKTLKQHYYPEVPWPQSQSSIIHCTVACNEIHTACRGAGGGWSSSWHSWSISSR